MQSTNFHLFMFQFVSKRFKTIKILDLDIFSLFQFVSVVLLYNLYVSMFRNTRYGAWNFHVFMLQFVSNCFFHAMAHIFFVKPPAYQPSLINTKVK